jgi:hypothetical protein
MKQQFRCEVGEDGAGAKYMYLYDSMPTHIRTVLAEANVNICMACFANEVNKYSDWGEVIAKISDFECNDLEGRREYVASF